MSVARADRAHRRPPYTRARDGSADATAATRGAAPLIGTCRDVTDDRERDGRSVTTWTSCHNVQIGLAVVVQRVTYPHPPPTPAQAATIGGRKKGRGK